MKRAYGKRGKHMTNKEFVLITHTFDVPYFNNQKRVRVLLPKDYQHTTKRYPVVYMHDGQNVFYDAESFSGKSWGVIETLDQATDLPDMIIVGIDHAQDKRMSEYSFWDIALSQTTHVAYGQQFGKFLVEQVKPFIDQTYRTLHDKIHTALIGSSMGGIITATLGVAYSHVFGHLGVFSLASWIIGQPFTTYIDTLTDTSQTIFLQVGANEVAENGETYVLGERAQLYLDSAVSYYTQLIRCGISVDRIVFKIAAHGRHNEQMWATYLPDCLRFFSQEWQ